MKLSIITINYNNRDGLELTAKSITEQSFRDFEWIVVDGGSDDGSRDVLKRYASYITWSVSEPDGGIYEAMNKGLEKAKGEYVQFLNSGDSFINESVLKKVFISERLADVNYGNQWCVLDGTIVEKRIYPDNIDLPFLFRNPLGHQASFIRTSLAKTHPYRLKYSISADRALFLELYISGASFFHLPFPIVYFDAGGIGSNSSTFDLRRNQLKQIKEELFSIQAAEDIEKMISKSEEFDFVMRVTPLRWTYSFFKWLQKVRYKLRWNNL